MAIPLHSTKYILITPPLQYSDADVHALFTGSELRPIARWSNPSNEYSLWLVERAPFAFPLLKLPTNSPVIPTEAMENGTANVSVSSTKSSPFGVPSLEDWRNMWKAWDTITLGMIPREMLLTKPIDLRHICLFYLGHIPAFLDIHLSRLLGQEHTEPIYFKDIFEVRLAHFSSSSIKLMQRIAWY